ncbi:MAG: DUF2188 domain-containing protein [Bryobacterales bacterium]|nr:DUF2188 domain-containing protein [Bryobacterales bacterium]
MKERRQHVVPDRRGSWSVRREGADRASRVFDSKVDAVAYARDLAKKSGGDLYVHAWDGSVRDKDTYAEESCPQRNGVLKR